MPDPPTRRTAPGQRRTAVSCKALAANRGAANNVAVAIAAVAAAAAVAVAMAAAATAAGVSIPAPPAYSIIIARSVPPRGGFLKTISSGSTASVAISSSL
jgi:hypothetical protein